MSLPTVHLILNEYCVPNLAGEREFFDDTTGNYQLKACARFIKGAQTAADIAWVRQALTAYLGSAGEVPLERCLHLPSTHTAWRKTNRDQWLCKAAFLIDAEGSWSGSQKLEDEWKKFISRGPWGAWRDEENPPEHATALSEALFYATRLNRSQSLNAKQICRIAGQVFQMKSR
jgi:hypothetical protein